MSTDNKPAIVPTVKLTKAVLDEPKTLSDMLNLPVLQDRWVSTYNATSAVKDGEMRFEAEKILFTQAIAANLKAFNKCDRFTIYAAFTELSLSNLSLRDGLTYIIPYGTKAQFQVGYKGRLEQINEMPEVVHVPQPEVVYDCDVFKFKKGMETIIEEHTPAPVRPEGAKITYVYLVIHFTYGKKAYIMRADQIEQIRDTFSKPYIKYLADLEKPINKKAGKKFGDKLKYAYKDNSDQWQEGESDDLPMWVSSPEKAYKKTLIKQVWDSLPKLAKHKMLDARAAQFFAENPGVTPVDPEETVKANSASNSTEDGVAEVLSGALNLDEDKEPITPHEDVTGEPEAKPDRPNPSAGMQPNSSFDNAEEIPESF